MRVCLNPGDQVTARARFTLKPNGTFRFEEFDGIMFAGLEGVDKAATDKNPFSIWVDDPKHPDQGRWHTVYIDENDRPYYETEKEREE